MIEFHTHWTLCLKSGVYHFAHPDEILDPFFDFCYLKRMTKRSLGLIASRKLVSDFLISGSMRRRMYSKCHGVILNSKYRQNLSSNEKSSWTRWWYSPNTFLRLKMSCTHTEHFGMRFFRLSGHKWPNNSIILGIRHLSPPNSTNFPSKTWRPRARLGRLWCGPLNARGPQRSPRRSAARCWCGRPFMRNTF